MAEETTLLTEEGHRKYVDRLNYLKTVRRGQVAERIRTAKEFGDISENAEYESAKAEQAFVEGEVSELEKLLRRAQIIKKNEVRTDEVGLMTRITIEETASGEKMTVDLVGSKESDPKSGRISNESPIGAALLGKQVGQTVDVKAPGGISTWKVLEIKSALA
ncbi:MAG: transcription elongation factor GreA [Candidatus Xenobium sp.]|jgi:transcription elongation factor GreA|nr:transcription elongation factor GreA [Burkholderiales bacterium]